MAFPKEVFIQESCPRDGWQNHAVMIDSDTKIKYIKRMIDCGIREIEVTSFVNPKLVPQMSDAKIVLGEMLEYAKATQTKLTALALNKRGADDAIAAGATNIAFVISASEEHNLRNSNRTLKESVTMLKELAKSVSGIDISLGMACVFGSPFGDEVSIDTIKWIIEETRAVGVKKFGLADTAGISTPKHTREVLKALLADMDKKEISLHMHDAHGMGIANCFVGLEEGISNFDSALAAMGGCPFVPKAKGNIATEDLVNMCHKMGIKTGIELDKLIKTAVDMCSEIQAPIGSSISITHAE